MSQTLYGGQTVKNQSDQTVTNSGHKVNDMSDSQLNIRSELKQYDSIIVSQTRYSYQTVENTDCIANIQPDNQSQSVIIGVAKQLNQSVTNFAIGNSPKRLEDRECHMSVIGDNKPVKKDKIKVYGQLYDKTIKEM